MSLLAAYLLRDETNALTSLENRIHIQQVHSWSGVKAPAGWRCATNFLPTRVITESKVGSDSEPFWNIRLLRIRRWSDSGTMIHPYPWRSYRPTKRHSASRGKCRSAPCQHRAVCYGNDACHRNEPWNHSEKLSEQGQRQLWLCTDWLYAFARYWFN